MFSGSQVELKQCHYLVDLATETEAPREPQYATNKEEWSIIAEKPFLDTTRQVFMCGVRTSLENVCKCVNIQEAFVGNPCRVMNNTVKNHWKLKGPLEGPLVLLKILVFL